MALVQIGVKVEESVKEQILDLVESGKYRDMTDFAVRAIREKLEREEFGGTPTLVDLQTQIDNLFKQIAETRIETEEKFKELELLQREKAKEECRKALAEHMKE